MEEIFKYISDKSGDNTYYLKSLNCLDGVDLDLYCSLGEAFPVRDIYALLSDRNWRPQLVAYTFALARNGNNGLDQFKAALSRGSFVSPQLIVAIAMLGKRESGKFLLELLTDSTTSSKSKGAIVAALPYCFVNEAALGEYTLDLSEFGMGHSIAEQHIRFWDKRGYVRKP
ncbi:hypothetical protein ACJJIF_03240 [Microbulbifer sp. SSSA002]|uniref:hypothetical protein n=1 Tax=unclassified Microbulbifer TaxID=2619833 RepID=UPI00403A4C46